MTATDVKIVTKQVVINKRYSSHLIPITGDEKCIDEIQEALNELEELKRYPTSDEVCEALRKHIKPFTE